MTYEQWFSKLFSGTDSHRRVKLRGKNNRYTLISVRHQGYDKWAGRSLGYTEHLLIENLCGLDNYGIPQRRVMTFEGRLLKHHKAQINDLVGALNK